MYPWYQHSTSPNISVVLCVFSESLIDPPGSGPTVASAGRDPEQPMAKKKWPWLKVGYDSFTGSGWWYTYPSEQYEFVSWDDEIPNIWKIAKCSKPPTSIYCWIAKYSSKLYLFGDYGLRPVVGKKEKTFGAACYPIVIELASLIMERLSQCMVAKMLTQERVAQLADSNWEKWVCWLNSLVPASALPKAFGWRVTRAWKKCKLITPFFALAKVKSAATAHPTTRPSYFNGGFNTYIKTRSKIGVRSLYWVFRGNEPHLANHRSANMTWDAKASLDEPI